MWCIYFIPCAGFKIHLNEVICKGLHHHVEYKLDWSSIQQSKYEWWDNHTSTAAQFFSNEMCWCAHRAYTYWVLVISNILRSKEMWIIRMWIWSGLGETYISYCPGFVKYVFHSLVLTVLVFWYSSGDLLAQAPLFPTMHDSKCDAQAGIRIIVKKKTTTLQWEMILLIAK